MPIDPLTLGLTSLPPHAIVSSLLSDEGKRIVLPAFFQRGRGSPDKTRQTLATAHASVQHSAADQIEARNARSQTAFGVADSPTSVFDVARCKRTFRRVMGPRSVLPLCLQPSDTILAAGCGQRTVRRREACAPRMSPWHRLGRRVDPRHGRPRAPTAVRSCPRPSTQARCRSEQAGPGQGNPSRRRARGP